MATISFGFARQSFLLLFPGLPDAVDDANSQLVIHPQGSGTMSVVGIEIVGTSGIAPGATGNTTARVSLVSLGTGIDATITEAQRRSASISTGSLVFTAGDPVYVHRPAIAGGHVDLQVCVHTVMGDRVAL